MKDIFKTFGILLTGLLVAVLIYPFLHEAGHALFTIFSGAELYEFHILPIPYVVCNVYSIDRLGQCFIGISGMIFPFIVSFLIINKYFWTWFISLILKGISLLSFVISYLAILCYDRNIIWYNEDIVKVVQIWEPFDGFWLFITLLLILLCSSSLYVLHPIKRIGEYFNIKIA